MEFDIFIDASAGIRIDGDVGQQVGGRERRRPIRSRQTVHGQYCIGPDPSEFHAQQTPAAVRRHGRHRKSIGKGCVQY